MIKITITIEVDEAEKKPESSSRGRPRKIANDDIKKAVALVRHGKNVYEIVDELGLKIKPMTLRHYPEIREALLTVENKLIELGWA